MWFIFYRKKKTFGLDGFQVIVLRANSDESKRIRKKKKTSNGISV